MSKAHYLEMGLHELITETDKVDMITMGRGEGPSCYCYVNNLLRKFADSLVSSYQWMVMDTEAGLEHISRRTAAHIDHLIVVVNESPLTADCARRVTELVPTLPNSVRKMHLVLNTVRDDRIERVRQKVDDLGMDYLGCIPEDEKLEELVFNGESIFKLDGGPATEKIAEMMQKITGDE
jgi:CO dehydrogenase maturation factor